MRLKQDGKVKNSYIIYFFALKRSTHQLAQSLRKAQEMTLSSQEFMGKAQGGYGIYLKEGTNKYTLFIDCDEDKQFNDANVCEYWSGGVQYGNVSDKIEDFILEKRINIETLSPYLQEGEDRSLSIIFIPPDPEIIFSPDASSASIKLNFENGPGQIIYINKDGLIEIE